MTEHIFVVVIDLCGCVDILPFYVSGHQPSIRPIFFVVWLCSLFYSRRRIVPSLKSCLHQIGPFSQQPQLWVATNPPLNQSRLLHHLYAIFMVKLPYTVDCWVISIIHITWCKLAQISVVAAQSHHYYPNIFHQHRLSIIANINSGFFTIHSCRSRNCKETNCFCLG